MQADVLLISHLPDLPFCPVKALFAVLVSCSEKV